MPLQPLPAERGSVNGRRRSRGVWGAWILTACLAVGAGCSKRPPPGPPEPPPAPARAVVSLDPQRSVAEIEREFAGEADSARRIEMIYELAMAGSMDALPVLQRIHASAEDAELREHVIRSLTFLAATDAQPALAFLSEALGLSQPAELRAVAAETLGEIEVAAAIPIWKTLVDDADPGLRAMARDSIDYLTARFPSR